MHFTLIMRHSNRKHIESSETALYVPLTMAGRARALHAGHFIKKHFGVVNLAITSMADRCYETAKLLTLSNSIFGKTPLRRETSMYGDFSSGYLKDGMMMPWLDAVGKDYLSEESYSSLMHKWVQMGLARCTLEDYVESVIPNYLKPFNLLVVTHDTIIAPIAEHLSKKYGFVFRPEMRYPPYLSGICLEHDEGKVKSLHWIAPPDRIQLWKNDREKMHF